MSNIEGDSIFDIFRHHAVSQEPLSLTLKEGLYVSPPLQFLTQNALTFLVLRGFLELGLVRCVRKPEKSILSWTVITPDLPDM